MVGFLFSRIRQRPVAILFSALVVGYLWWKVDDVPRLTVYLCSLATAWSWGRLAQYVSQTAPEPEPTSLDTLAVGRNSDSWHKNLPWFVLAVGTFAVSLIFPKASFVGPQWGLFTKAKHETFGKYRPYLVGMAVLGMAVTAYQAYLTNGIWKEFWVQGGIFEPPFLSCWIAQRWGDKLSAGLRRAVPAPLRQRPAPGSLPRQ